MGVIRRISDYRSLLGDDDPRVFILAPSADRAIPAGDTRRGTAWVFTTREGADAFGAWMRGRHGLEAVPVQVQLRQLAAALSERDLTWVLDPKPEPGLRLAGRCRSPRRWRSLAVTWIRTSFERSGPYFDVNSKLRRAGRRGEKSADVDRERLGAVARLPLRRHRPMRIEWAETMASRSCSSNRVMDCDLPAPSTMTTVMAVSRSGRDTGRRKIDDAHDRPRHAQGPPGRVRRRAQRRARRVNAHPLPTGVDDRSAVAGPVLVNRMVDEIFITARQLAHADDHPASRHPAGSPAGRGSGAVRQELPLLRLARALALPNRHRRPGSPLWSSEAPAGCSFQSRFAARSA